MKILLVVAARGGSKGLKNKNLLKLYGKSLTFITLKKVSCYKKLDKIALTSDSKKILNEASSFSRIIKIKRPKNLASDKSNIFLAVKHAVNKIKKDSLWTPDIILLTTPTTPFKTLYHFKKCIEFMIKKKANSVMTIRKPDYPTHWMLLKKGKYLRNVINNGNKFKRRQDTPETFQPAGTVYGFNSLVLDHLIKSKKIFPLKHTQGVVVSRKQSINIDTIDDYQIAKSYKN